MQNWRIFQIKNRKEQYEKQDFNWYDLSDGAKVLLLKGVPNPRKNSDGTHTYEIPNRNIMLALSHDGLLKLTNNGN